MQLVIKPSMSDVYQLDFNSTPSTVCSKFKNGFFVIGAKGSSMSESFKYASLYIILPPCLHLCLRQSVLPNRDVWCDSILPIVQQHNPNTQRKVSNPETKAHENVWKRKVSIHAIRIHRLSSVEVEIFEIGRDMFGIIILSPGLKRLHFVLVGAMLFELLHNLFKISCPTGECCQLLTMMERKGRGRMRLRIEIFIKNLPFSCV